MQWNNSHMIIRKGFRGGVNFFKNYAYSDHFLNNKKIQKYQYKSASEQFF